MNIYVKIGENSYEASITGRLNDKDWDGRASKSIKLAMSYEDAIKTFVDDIEWYIVQESEETVEKFSEGSGEPYYTIETMVETYDNSDYSIAGDIIDHRDGTITVKMGKPTAEELLDMIIGGITL